VGGLEYFFILYFLYNYENKKINRNNFKTCIKFILNFKNNLQFTTINFSLQKVQKKI